MSRSRQSLVAAVLSTFCAGTWGINCTLDVALSIPASLGRDALLTLLWTGVALCWWLRWRAECRRAADS